MPQGNDAFERKRQQKEAQRAQFGNNTQNNGPNPDFFYLNANEYAIVRVLEQGDDLTFADVHRVPIQSKRGRFFRDFICLNTNGDGSACPCCQQNSDVAKVTTRGFVNVIWREGPVYQRDENSRVVRDGNGKPQIIGREDGVFLWKASWTTFEMLKEKDRKWRGVMSRDWEIKRIGSGLDDTKYFIEPADPATEAQGLTIADMALAENKYNLTQLTTPLSYDELAQTINRGSQPGVGPQPTADRSALMGQAPNMSDAFNSGQTPQVRASAFDRPSSGFSRG